MEWTYLTNLRSAMQARTDAGEQGITINYVHGTPKIIKKKRLNSNGKQILHFYFQNVNLCPF